MSVETVALIHEVLHALETEDSRAASMAMVRLAKVAGTHAGGHDH
ncbi:MAG: hypothetical protein RRC07_00555 [Anaerolineae bacterium]|nr:hypothetical protein [Anaerolineae bacterium]